MTSSTGQYGKYRFWEILPAALVWLTFLFALGLSFFAPTWAIIFIILFDLYWAMRVLYFLIFVLVAYRQFKQVSQADWYENIQAIDGWEDLYHVVMLPTYKEDVSILREAMRAIDQSIYRNDRFVVVLGGEQADEQHFRRYAREIEEEYSDIFAKLIVTVHPKGLPGEMPGKGSNMKWMEEAVAPVLENMGIADEKAIVTAFDVDTVAHPQYFARLSYLFLTVDKPTRASYQPVVLYSNNVWSVKAPVRISMFGTTFWLLSELVRADRMWTFSSHSMSWKMLKDVGFHEPDLVSEDSRIFMQGLIHYDGDYRVEPMLLPVYMDAVDGETWWESMKALYKQQRRWAWGVEHLPYMWEKFREHPNMPRTTKIRFFLNHIEGMYTWSTAPILIFALGYVPFWTLSDVPSALIANAPFTLEWMMRVATIGVFVSAWLSLWLLPKRPPQRGVGSWLVMIAQWVLLPVTFIVFGAFPAIDAQTRMMLGKYLGFNVTRKRQR